MGYDVIRSHEDPGVQSRFHVCFVASIIRSHIERLSKKYRLDTNVTIQKLHEIHLGMRHDVYYAVNNMSEKIKSLLKDCGIITKDLTELATFANNRMASQETVRYHILPRQYGETENTIQSKKQDDSDDLSNTAETATKKKRGRPMQ